MPIYEYRCERCGERIERMQRIADPPPAECPACGGPLRKLVSAPAFQFKGSGWYVTDYARKSEGGAKSDDQKAGKATGGDGAAPAGDKTAGGGAAGDASPSGSGSGSGSGSTGGSGAAAAAGSKTGTGSSSSGSKD